MVKPRATRERKVRNLLVMNAQDHISMRCRNFEICKCCSSKLSCNSTNIDTHPYCNGLCTCFTFVVLKIETESSNHIAEFLYSSCSNALQTFKKNTMGVIDDQTDNPLGQSSGLIQTEKGCCSLWWQICKDSCDKRSLSCLSLHSIIAFCAICGFNSAFSIVTVNSFCSMFCLNSIFSIGSMNSAFAIGCVNEAFKVCLFSNWVWRDKILTVKRYQLRIFGDMWIGVGICHIFEK